MTAVGQQLLQPELGWKRYDDNDVNIEYSSNMRDYLSDLWYGGSLKATMGENAYFKFNFTGTQIRLISQYHSDISHYSNNIKIKIDGKTENFSQLFPTVHQVICYEKTNLTNSEHYVEVFTDDNLGFNIDAIDIDDTGELQSYSEIMKKYLVKSSNKIYTLNEVTNTLEDITSTIVDINNITKLEYETYGFNDLIDVTPTQIDGLIKPISVLYYRNNVDNMTSTPKLRQEYNLNVGVRQMIKKPMV